MSHPHYSYRNWWIELNPVTQTGTGKTLTFLFMVLLVQNRNTVDRKINVAQYLSHGMA